MRKCLFIFYFVVFRSYVIDSYSTEIFEQNYYFPSCGTFNQFPPQASIDGVPVAVGEQKSFSVVQRLRNVDKNWNFICRFGTDDEIIEMLKTLNVTQDEVSVLSWRLNNNSLYTRVMEILRDRNVFNVSIWSWSFFHADVETMKEYFHCLDNKNYLFGDYFQSNFFSFDLKQAGTYTHLEYGKF